MKPITACLWFNGNADEAVDRYLSIFPDSRRTSDSKYGKEGPGQEDKTMVVNFELGGTPFMAINGGDEFAFTPAISFVVNCATQAEVDRYWELLVDGGKEIQCGWLTDRYGVSWQIVPDRLGELLGDPDPDKAERVMKAMLRMVKLDISELEAAAAG